MPVPKVVWYGNKPIPAVPALKWNNDLEEAVQMYSNDMFKNYFSHVSTRRQIDIARTFEKGELQLVAECGKYYIRHI